ncbi:hypothetical protein ADUPG1_012315 [Aduncisulcus paluster]|uniref:Uncharacterized protein n=1 Tax=Aduncisulcus paluster TaxID=2918883 RepID=A0ABQ5K3T7_9EUKA|nr:hypothetical protein ADUPG1_012315 [Aduncisulcus paluster]
MPKRPLGGRRLFKGVKSCTGLVSSELCFGTVKYLAVIVGWYSDSEMAPDSSIFAKWMSSSFDGLVTTSGVGALELGRNMAPALSHSTMVWQAPSFSHSRHFDDIEPTGFCVELSIPLPPS